jgi:hypothetical protein
MKRMANIMTKIVNLPFSMVFFLCVLGCVLTPAQGTYVIYGLPESQGTQGINYFIFSRWILMMSAPVLVNGYCLERSRKIELYSTLRMKKISDFHLYLCYACAANITIWTSFISIGAIFIDTTKIALQLFAVLLPNCWMWGAAQCMLYFILRKAAWSGLLVIALIGGVCLVGEYLPSIYAFTPSAWGMLSRSATFISNGLKPSHMVIYSFLLFLLCTVITVHNKKEEM